jgi:hypothetical protein
MSERGANKMHHTSLKGAGWHRLCKSLITKVTLGLSISKGIRTAKHQFYSLLDLQDSKSLHFPLESNLNIDQNRST